MILHVELPLIANHVLIATDAPKEMGFTLTQGNNMHISLEPETRTEAKRLFDALSTDGNITMPLEDINEAFDLMHKGESIRTVIHF